MKRIVSYGLWGQKTCYTDGAIRAVKENAIHFPDWKVRFYIDKKVNPEVIRQLEGMPCEIVMKDDEGNAGLGLFWRFEPMFDDPDIERFMVRDTDSVPSPREVAAVQEWIDSGQPFHIMRDNPSHNVPILGGTWAAKPGCVPNFKEMMEAYMSRLKVHKQDNPRGNLHGTDQMFLSECVWPVIKNIHIAHDEFHHFSGKERPFPVKNENGMFIGQTF